MADFVKNIGFQWIRWVFELGVRILDASPTPPPGDVENPAEQPTSDRQLVGSSNSSQLFHKLSRAVFVMAFAEAAALLVLYTFEPGPHAALLLIFAFLLAFSVSIIGIFLRRESTAMARFLGLLAVVSLVLGILPVSSAFLSVELRWAIWLTCAAAMVIILASFLYSFISGDDPETRSL